MERLARAERYEEAAAARDRLRTLASALRRARQDRWLVDAGRLDLEIADGRRITLVGGALARAGRILDPIPLPCPRERADELSAARSWLSRNPVRILACDRPLAEPVDGGARLERILRSSRDPDRGGRLRHAG
jgi:hypothetical protein